MEYYLTGILYTVPKVQFAKWNNALSEVHHMHVNYCDMDWHLKYIQLPNDEASFLAYLEESKGEIRQNIILKMNIPWVPQNDVGQIIIVEKNIPYTCANIHTWWAARIQCTSREILSIPCSTQMYQSSSHQLPKI